MKRIKIFFATCIFSIFYFCCSGQDVEEGYVKVNESPIRYHSLSSIISNVDSIYSVELVTYDLQEAFDTLYMLKHLKELNIFACHYDSLPVGIGRLSDLETLNLDYTNITSLPEDFRRLRKIRSIRINKHDCYGVSDCRFKVPVWIDELENLESIAFKDCDMKPFPDGFYGLKKLKSIWLMHGTFKDFPHRLLEMESLESVFYIYGGGVCPNVDKSKYKVFECEEWVKEKR